MIKEICVESFQEAIHAAAAGANRIELCENLSMDGTTPSYGTIKKTVNALSIPVMVMIRPRKGNFCYTSEELEIMKTDIQVCKQLGATGVVFGVLLPDQTVDLESTRMLVQLAHPLQVTFHKAIDETPDPVEATRLLAQIGVNRILSSGGASTAMEGCETLKLMMQAGGNRTQIIIAGKVTYENFETVAQLLPSGEYHGKRIVKL